MILMFKKAVNENLPGNILVLIDLILKHQRVVYAGQSFIPQSLRLLEFLRGSLFN